jgi:predicted RNA-binding protein Jag
MSEAAMNTEPAAMVRVGVTPAPAERKAQAEALVKGIFQHMDYPARLELKDMPDGGIGIACFFEGELPGITPGKQRSWLVDCVQFLVNKSVNRPTLEKRWVTLGVNTFPELRADRPEKKDGPPVAAAPSSNAAKKPQGPAKGEATSGPKPVAEKPGRAPRHHEPDERSIDVKDDPAVTKLFTQLAEKAVKTGRIYAVMSLSTDDRARCLKVAATVKGVSAKAEGEGHWRRVTVTPEKLTAMPSKRQVMPDYDDEEE